MEDISGKKVSVIITTYNREIETLERAINSVLNQTYSNCEILIVDDNVDANLSQKIKNYVKKRNHPCITYMKNVHEHGACAARNLGALNAKGQILAFLDDDDTWTDNKLEEMVPLINEKVGFVYCTANLYRGNQKVKNKNVGMKPDDKNLIKQILKFNFIGGCSIPIFTKRKFIEAGMFDNSFLSSQDVDVWIRLLKITDIAYVDKPLVNYYITDGAITRNFDKQNAGTYRMLEKYSEEYELYPDAKEAAYKKLIMAYLLDGKLQDAKREYLVCYKNNRKGYCINLTIFIKGMIKLIINQFRGYN